MATYKSFADLTEQQKQQFGDEDSYKKFMDTNVMETNPVQQEQQPSTQNTLTDPTEFAQAQVGAAVRQPSLPTGGSVMPGLALQTPTTQTLQTTPGLTGTQAAPITTTPTAPTITPQAVPTSATISQQPQVTAPQYQAVTGATTPQMDAAQGTVSAPLVAQQEDLTALPPEATVQGQLANISNAINTAVDEGKPIPAFASGAK